VRHAIVDGYSTDPALRAQAERMLDARNDARRGPAFGPTGLIGTGSR